jgi:hypothetical protein
MARTQKSRPTLTVFVVEGEGDKAFWTKIGAAWSHEDGLGYDVALTAMPLNGRLVVPDLSRIVAAVRRRSWGVHRSIFSPSTKRCAASCNWLRPVGLNSRTVGSLWRCGRSSPRGKPVSGAMNGLPAFIRSADSDRCGPCSLGPLKLRNSPPTMPP